MSPLRLLFICLSASALCLEWTNRLGKQITSAPIPKRPPSRRNGQHVSFHRPNLAAETFGRQIELTTYHKLSRDGRGQSPIVREIDELSSSDDDEKYIMLEMGRLEDEWNSDSGSSSEEEGLSSSTKRTSAEVKGSGISTELKSPGRDLQAVNPAPARARSLIRPHFQLIDSAFFEPETRFAEALQHCWHGRQLSLQDFFWLLGGLGIIVMLLTLWGFLSYILWDNRTI